MRMKENLELSYNFPYSDLCLLDIDPYEGVLPDLVSTNGFLIFCFNALANAKLSGDVSSWGKLLQVWAREWSKLSKYHYDSENL